MQYKTLANTSIIIIIIFIHITIISLTLKHISVTGTTGEGNSLTMQERKKVVEKWITAGKGKYVNKIEWFV